MTERSGHEKAIIAATADILQVPVAVIELYLAGCPATFFDLLLPRVGEANDESEEMRLIRIRRAWWRHRLCEWMNEANQRKSRWS